MTTSLRFVLAAAVALPALQTEELGFVKWTEADLRGRHAALSARVGPDHSARETLAAYGHPSGSHRFRLIHRNADGVPEQHANIGDVVYVYSGAATLLVGGDLIDIPGGVADIKIDSTAVLQENVKLSVFEPHMHAAGVRFCLHATYGSTTETINCAGYASSSATAPASMLPRVTPPRRLEAAGDTDATDRGRQQLRRSLLRLDARDDRKHGRLAPRWRDERPDVWVQVRA